VSISANNSVNKINKFLYLLIPLFILGVVVSQTATLKNLFASSNTFPSAQFKNSPIGFELYEANGVTKYISRGNNFALFLTPTEAVVTLNDANTSTPAVLRMQFLGANKTTTLTGLGNTQSKSHYFMGNDPTKWKTDITRYGKVRYEALYPGIDLLFYGNQSELEYDFIVAPNIDPDIIRLNFTGAKKLSISNNGDLLIETSAGRVLQKKPIVYQNTLNKQNKKIINSRYVLLDKNTIGFNIGNYDHSQPLIIDPILDYATYIGGSDQDNGTKIAIDSNGYIYITGYTFSSDFPSGAVLGSNISAFITKLTPDGSSVVFSIYLGGSGTDRGRDIAISDEGDIYIVGETTSTDFPVLASAHQLQNNGGTDVFMTVISRGGSHLHYSTYFGGSGYDAGRGLAIGNNDQVYLTGETWSDDLLTTNSLDSVCGTGSTCTNSQSYDAFFTVIDLLSNDLLYSTYLGGNGNDRAHAVAVDLATGYSYIVGESNSSDFPRQKPILPIIPSQQPLGDNLQGFLTVIDPTLTNRSSLIFSSFLGGTKEDVVDSVTVDASGNAYLFGYTNSIDFPVKNAYQEFLRGETDSFIAKIDPSAATGPDALIYATYLGGSGAELAYGVAVDDLNRTYIVGTTSSTDFPTVAPFQNENAGGIDVFVATLTPDGSSLQYASYLGGSGDETGSGIAVTADGAAYIVGDSTSSTLPTPRLFIQTASLSTLSGTDSSTNAFIAKVTPPDSLPVQSNNNSSTTSNTNNPVKSSGGGSMSPLLLITLLLLFTIQFSRRNF